MASSQSSKPDRDAPELVLGILSAVEQDASVTQRGLSSELGIALGMANAVLKRCVRKGLIKIKAAPLNRYAYYLTPSGFAEKGRLTIEYLSVSFDLFRDARSQFTAIFRQLDERALRRVALLGVSELTEAALLSSREANVEIVGVVDVRHAHPVYLGLPVAASLDAIAGTADALVLCDMHDPVAAFDDAIARAASLGLDRSRVIAPSLLRLGKRRARQASEAAQ